MAQRTWFITGVNSGFGRHLSEQLLERGDRVAGTIRKDGSVDDLIGKYGDQFWTAHLDVTDVPAIRTVVGRAFTQLGRIDVIVSNAGYGLFGANLGWGGWGGSIVMIDEAYTQKQQQDLLAMQTAVESLILAQCLEGTREALGASVQFTALKLTKAGEEEAIRSKRNLQELPASEA